MQNISNNQDLRRTDATKQQYKDVVIRRIRVVAIQLGIEPGQVTPAHLVEDFFARSQNLRPDSIRYHRSALADWFRNSIGDKRVRELYLDKLEKSRYRLQGNTDSESPSKYAGEINRKDWEAVRSHLYTLTPGWPLSAGLLMEATLHTGVRPAEWKEARLVEIPTQWMIDSGIVWPGSPSDRMPYLVVRSARHTNQKGKENERLVPVLPEALDSIRAVLDLLKNAMTEGKSFAIWQKEIQRGCRNLMKSVFPRRKNRYTLYSTCRQQDAPGEVLMPRSVKQQWLGSGEVDAASDASQQRDVIIVVDYRRPFIKPAARPGG